MELGGVPEKWMNIFTVDLYSMYVVLQGIWYLSCIRVYIIYIIYIIYAIYIYIIYIYYG